MYLIASKSADPLMYNKHRVQTTNARKQEISSSSNNLKVKEENKKSKKKNILTLITK